MSSYYYAPLGDREAENSWWLKPGRSSKSKHSLWDERSPGNADLLDPTLCVYRIVFHTCTAQCSLEHHELKYKTQLAGLVTAVTKARHAGGENEHFPVAVGPSIRQSV